MIQMSKLRQALPLNASTIGVLVILAVLFAAMCGLAMVEFPQWSNSSFSPLELAIWLTLFASAAVSVNAMRDASPDARRTLQVAFAVLSMIVALQTIDFALEWDGQSVIRRWLLADSLLSMTIGIIVAAALIWLLASRRPRRGVVVALLAIIGFQIIALLSEFEESGKLPAALSSHLYSTEFLELLCIEAYLVGLVIARGRSASAPPLSAKGKGHELGTYARTAFYRLSLVRDARHPPALLAFVPGMTTLVVMISAAVLALYAGSELKAARGISRWRQFKDMVALWQSHRIDPPSYYALDLFLPENMARAGEYLTRYETKNGLLYVLNYEGKDMPPKGELGDKQLFREVCAAAGVETPRTLAVASASAFVLKGSDEELQRDLFCKHQKGMGAIGTAAYVYEGQPGHYRDEAGKPIASLQDLAADIQSHASKKPMIVQPWLRNHPEIASLADRSLLVFRVITCLDQTGAPVVAVAMLRLLAKLEPDWHKQLPDGEYASPIDIDTGELGKFTGDSPKTAALRYDRHPITAERINGRRLECWQEVKDFALKVHRAIPYRTVVGWDIALTPDGPVALEGNSNFDVMFLQRVLDLPLGLTPLSPLLRPHIEALYVSHA